MSKDIWHTTDEAPKSWVRIAFYVDGFLYEGYYDSESNQYGIFDADKVEKWCYIKELSPYIPALETELECTRKALDIAKNAINSAVDHNIINCVARGIDPKTDDTNVTLCNAIEQITALEQKDK